MVLLGLSGKRRSGKTTLARELEKFGWKHYSLAAELKRMMREEFGLTEEQTDGSLKETVDPRYGKTPRQMMIEFGKAKRDEDPAYWIKRVMDTMLKAPQAQMQKAVISDVRFLNEGEWIYNHGGYVVRLEREEEFTGKPIDDPSECELDHYDFDFIVEAKFNRTMEDIYDTAEIVDSLVTTWESKKKAV